MIWLLSWLWQTTLLVAMVDLLLRLQRKLDASARYAVWFAVLLAVVVVWPLAAPRLVQSEAEPRRSVALREAGAERPAEEPIGSVAAGSPTAMLQIALPAQPGWVPLVIACVWLGAALVRLTLVFRSCAEIARLKSDARPMPEAIAGRLPGWTAERGRGRAVSLSVSNASRTPAALGLGRGSIVIPDSLLTELQPDELDQVVLHELAHLRRRDDWTRLAQATAQAIAALHPAVWWIGRRLDLEREAACDAFVVRRTAGRRAYALCLTKVAALSQSSHPIAELASAATRSGRELTERVARLLNGSARGCGWQSAAAGLLTIAVASTVAGGGASRVSFVSGPAPAAAATSESAPAARAGAGPRPNQEMTRGAAARRGGAPHAVDAVDVDAVDVDVDVDAVDAVDNVQGPAPAAARTVRGIDSAQRRFASAAGRQSPASPPARRAAASESAPVVRGPASGTRDPGSRAVQPDPGHETRPAVERSQTATLLEATPIGATVGVPPPTPSMPAMHARAVSAERNRWLAFADAGVAVGTGVKDAGLATAGFFASFGRSVAAAF